MSGTTIRRQIRKQQLKSALVVAMLVGLVIWHHDFVATGFFSNAYLNGTIIGAFLFGLGLAFWSMHALRREEIAFLALQEGFDDLRQAPEKGAADPFWRHYRCFEPGTVFGKPKLLGHVYELIMEELLRTKHFKISLHTLESMMASIQAKLVHERGLLQYMVGLLVFLGLIGTFIGLMKMVGSVGGIIGGLAGADAGSNDAFRKLLGDLEAPLVGMATGFSASLFGLFSSLVLGLIARFVASAGNAIKEEAEAWLAAVARIEKTATGEAGADNPWIGSGPATALAATLGTAAQTLARNAAAVEALVSAQGDQRTLALATYGILDKLAAEHGEMRRALLAMHDPIAALSATLRDEVRSLRSGIEEAFGRVADRLEATTERGHDIIEARFADLAARHEVVAQQMDNGNQRLAQSLNEVGDAVRTGFDGQWRRLHEITDQQGHLLRFGQSVKGALETELDLLAQTIERLRGHQDDQAERLNLARQEIFNTLRSLDNRAELKAELREIAGAVEGALAQTAGDLVRAVGGAMTAVIDSLDQAATRQGRLALELKAMSEDRASSGDVEAMVRALEQGMVTGFNEVARSLAVALQWRETIDQAMPFGDRPPRPAETGAAAAETGSRPGPQPREPDAARAAVAAEALYAAARQRLESNAA